MTDPLGDLIRDTLTEFSQEARAVNLTQPALRQAKRRRTVVMTLSVGAFVVLAAAATPLAFAAVNQDRPSPPTVPAPADPTAPSPVPNTPPPDNPATPSPIPATPPPTNPATPSPKPTEPPPTNPATPSPSPVS